MDRLLQLGAGGMGQVSLDHLMVALLLNNNEKIIKWLFLKRAHLPQCSHLPEWMLLSWTLLRLFTYHH